MPVTLPQWLQNLRQTEIIDRVRSDPRSTDGSTLGVDRGSAMNAVGGGQADFDDSWGVLSSDDRVLLYAYYLQLGHLEELTEAFRMLFAGDQPRNPIVVDLGCGPFTGGLAIAGALRGDTRFDYIGVDQSRAMRHFGEQLASAAGRLEATPQNNVRHWSSSMACVSWNAAPGWRDVVVIMSYLFASPTLDVSTFTVELEGLLSRLGRGRVTVLYTNSVRRDANITFPAFSDALRGAGFRLHADDTGSIEIERRDGVRIRPIRYALFHRDRRSGLQLGER